MSEYQLLAQILQELANSGDPSDIPQVVKATQTELQQVLGKNIPYGSPEYILGEMTRAMLLIMAMSNPNYNVFKGLRRIQTGGGLGKGLFAAIAYFATLGINTLEYGAADSTAAPTVAQEAADLTSGVVNFAVSAALPEQIVQLGRNANELLYRLTGTKPSETYLKLESSDVIWAPQSTVVAAVEEQLNELREQKTVADTALIEAQAAVNSAAARLVVCSPGLSANVRPSSLTCPEGAQEAARVVELLTNPEVVRAAVVSEINKANAAAAAAAEPVFGAATAMASLIAPKEHAANLLTAPANSKNAGNSAIVVANRGQQSPFGSLMRRASSAVASAKNVVASATKGVVAAAQASAAKTLEEAAVRAKERERQMAIVRNLSPSLPLLTLLSENPMAHFPILYGARALELISGTQPVYPTSVSLLNDLRDAIERVALPLAKRTELRLRGTGNNTNTTSLDPLLQTFMDAIVAAAPKGVDAMAIDTEIIAIQSGNILSAMRSFDSNIDAFIAAAKKEPDMVPYIDKYVRLFRMMRVSPKPEKLVTLISKIVAAEGTGVNKANLQLLAREAHDANLPMKKKIIRIFWLTLFQYIVYFGTPALLCHLIFLLAGGAYAIVIQGIGGAAMFAGRQAGRIIESLVDVVVAAARLTTAKIEAKMPPRPALTNAATGGQGGGRRRTRRRRGKAKKARKSRRYQGFQKKH